MAINPKRFDLFGTFCQIISTPRKTDISSVIMTKKSMRDQLTWSVICMAISGINNSSKTTKKCLKIRFKFIADGLFFKTIKNTRCKDTILAHKK